MYRGYVKTWRKILDSGWLKNHKLLAFWMWCLVKASHKEYDLIVGYQKVHLLPGQFVFGLNKASEELNISIRSIRTLVEFMKKSENLTIKTTNKFSIVSIVNWDIYQSDEITNDNQNDKPLTNNRQATDKLPTTNKHIKNEKNEKNNIALPEWMPKETWESFLEMRKTIRSTPTKKATELLIEKLGRLKSEGNDPRCVLEESISNNWKGLFPLKTGGNGNGNGIRTSRSDPRDTSLQSRTDANLAAIWAERDAAKAASANKPRGVSGGDDAPDFGSGSAGA